MQKDNNTVTLELTPSEAELLHFLRNHDYKGLSKLVEDSFLIAIRKPQELPGGISDTNVFCISELYKLMRETKAPEFDKRQPLNLKKVS